MLALTVAAPGDFSTYQLTIFSDQLDPFFSRRRSRSRRTARRRSTARSPGGQPAGRGRAGADRLPGQGLRQLPAGAVGVLRPALPRLGGAVRGRPGHDADGGARRAWPTSSATTRTGSPRNRRSRPPPSGCPPSGTPGWWTTSRRRRPWPRPSCSSTWPARPRTRRRRPPAGRSTRRCWCARSARTVPSSTSRSRTRPRAWPARGQLRRRRPVEPGRNLVALLLGRQPARACRPARPAATSSAMASGSIRASSCCSTPAGRQRRSPRPRARRPSPAAKEIFDLLFGVDTPPPQALTQVSLRRPPPRTTTWTAPRSPATSCQRSRACAGARRS